VPETQVTDSAPGVPVAPGLLMLANPLMAEPSRSEAVVAEPSSEPVELPALLKSW